ncbi:dTMP kinase [Fodinibius sp.]|uniref:dTMP kinase n=1 Tax=Fodinibius sp. TaxID=1872440 RepID=UPI002ACDFE53|nr:dTMP kinase [Fodinibius sp.]MDZ7659224.1 dTMP kinase [Fodinibius sp.]
MFITFEGIDGSGKSTQIEKLRNRLEEKGALVDVYRDPGGPVVSEQIREILLNPDFEINSVTELLLFSAARSQLMAENVLPGLKEGKVVILDRFFDSTTAYQGYGRESVSLQEIHNLNTIASHKRKPDVTIYMKLSLTDAKQRMAKIKDRMELSGDEFFEKVIAGYNKLADREDRFFTVDATEPVSKVHKRIWKHIKKRYEY